MNPVSKAAPPRGGTSRGQDTILFVSPARLIRADFTGGGKNPVLEQLYEVSSPASSEGLAVLVDAALGLGPLGKRNVYVLSTGLQTLGLSVARNKVDGLVGADLVKALSFEAEVVSGLDSFGAATGVRLLGQESGESRFWLCQMAGDELRQIQLGFAAHKAELKGILHPGGLPSQLTGRSEGSTESTWQRTELWPDQVICVAGAGETIRAQIIGVPASRTTWQNEAEQWFGASRHSGPRECLAPDPVLLEYGSGTKFSLSEEGVLKIWLTAWARELLSGSPRVPCIVPERLPMPARQRWAVSGVMAAGVAGICLVHALVMAKRERQLRAEIAEMQMPINHLAALRARVDQLQAELAKRQNEEAQLKELQFIWTDTLGKEHRRHALLMGALSASTPLDMVVTSISEEPGNLQVKALSLTPDATSFITNLAARIQPVGWQIEPPVRRALGYQEDGGPWALEYHVHPANRVTAPTVVPSAGDWPLLLPTLFSPNLQTNELVRSVR